MSESEQQISKPAAAWQTLLREPTVHFFAIAALLFGLYSFTQSRQENLLEISQREIDARVFMQEMTSGQELTAEQRQFVTSSYIEEQILVREALAMNLDNDARIHDMLAQKMRHVLSGNIIQPSTEELDSYYRANLDRYRTSPTVTVDELVFNSSANLPGQVSALLDAGANPQAMLELEPGNNSPLPNVNHIDLANIFEPEFADRVFAAVPGQWIGPFISNRGQHWLRVNQQTDASLPTLDVITDRVRMDWVAEEEDRRLQEEVDKLWDRYAIRITDDVENR